MTSVTTGSEQILLPPKRTVISETITETFNELDEKTATKIQTTEKLIVNGKTDTKSIHIGTSRGTRCEAIVRPAGGFQRKRRTSGAGSTEVYRSNNRS